MKQTIDYGVVMLPAKHIGGGYKIIYSSIDNTIRLYDNKPWGRKDSPQHLYFTSGDEVIPNTWFITQKYGLQKCTSINRLEGHNLIYFEGNFCSSSLSNKVIASTDPSLGLPAIPESFLKQYVAANGKIDKVKLEQWFDIDDDEDGPMSSNEMQSCKTLKVTANNEVVIVNEPTIKEALEMREIRDTKAMQKLLNYQELEDAADKRYPCSIKEKYQKAAFKAGANWQKDKSPNDVVEFARWCMRNLIVLTHEDDCIYHDKHYSRKQLYELWQKRLLTLKNHNLWKKMIFPIPSCKKH